MIVKDKSGNTLLGKIDATKPTSTNKIGLYTEPTLDEGGGLNLAWLRINDNFKYKVTIPVAGIYTFAIRSAAVNNAQLQINIDGSALTFGIASTGGWQKWATVLLQIELTAGTKELSVTVLKEGLNINYFYINPFSVKVGDFTITETSTIVQ